eukprot:5307557-Prymnesium_polylepis.2
MKPRETLVSLTPTMINGKDIGHRLAHPPHAQTVSAGGPWSCAHAQGTRAASANAHQTRCSSRLSVPRMRHAPPCPSRHGPFHAPPRRQQRRRPPGRVPRRRCRTRSGTSTRRRLACGTHPWRSRKAPARAHDVAAAVSARGHRPRPCADSGAAAAGCSKIGPRLHRHTDGACKGHQARRLLDDGVADGVGLLEAVYRLVGHNDHLVARRVQPLQHRGHVLKLQLPRVGPLIVQRRGCEAVVKVKGGDGRAWLRVGVRPDEQRLGRLPAGRQRDAAKLTRRGRLPLGAAGVVVAIPAALGGRCCAGSVGCRRL